MDLKVRRPGFGSQKVSSTSEKTSKSPKASRDVREHIQYELTLYKSNGYK